MARDTDQDTGIPTRAIHEAYLSLEQTHQEYRRARDRGADTHELQGRFQDGVLTFYELLRPHLKHESALSEYWRGNLPDYSGWHFQSEREAVQYVKDQGTGVYQVQPHTNIHEIEQRTLTDGGQPETHEEWHHLLGLHWDTERVVSVQQFEQPDLDGDGDSTPRYYCKILRCAVLPLRQLDNWRARITTSRESGSGFMAGETHTSQHREFKDRQKLVAAKRLLVEAADKLGALSEFEASTQRTEITREDLEKVEQWRQDQIN